jgi:hypothetical protein
MKLELILAIAAIVLAIFNRPLEILWDKLFGIKKDTLRAIFINLLKYARYVIPIWGLIYLFYRTPFGKPFVFFVALYCSMLVFTSFIDLFFHLRRRIRILEDDVKYLLEDNNQLKKLTKEGKVNELLNDEQKYAMKKWIDENSSNHPS